MTNEKKKEIFIHVLFVILLMIIISYKIFKRPGLWFADEFGYSGTAALISGLDWSDQISNIAYYGVGLSIWLAPAYKFCKSTQQVVIYTGCLNMLFIFFSFELSIRFLNIILPKSEKYYKYLYAVVSILYINNIVQVQLAWTETLNLFLYWLIINLLTELIIKNKTKYYFYICIVICYMVIVHMRNIGIVLAVLFSLAICFVSKKKIQLRQIVVFMSVAIVGMFLFFWTKDVAKALLWNHSKMSSINDVGVNILKAKQIFSYIGIYNFCISVICKFFYIAVSTLGLLPLGVCYVLKLIRNNKIDIVKKTVFLAVLLCTMTPFLVGCIAMMNPGRVDAIMYGRYFETYIGALLCIVLYGIKINESFSIKEISVYFIFTIFSAIITQYKVISLGKMFAIYPCISGLGKYFSGSFELRNIIWKIVLDFNIKVIIVMIVIMIHKFFDKKYKKNYLFLIVSILICCFWIWDARIEVDSMIKHQQNRYIQVQPICDALEKYDINYNTSETIYYLMQENESWNEYLLALQFKLGKNKVQNVQSDEKIYMIYQNPHFVITKNFYDYDNVNMMENYEKKYKPICATEQFILFRCVTN